MAKHKQSIPAPPITPTKRLSLFTNLPVGGVVPIINNLTSTYLKTYQKHPIVSDLVMTTTARDNYYDVVCVYQDTPEGAAEVHRFVDLTERTE